MSCRTQVERMESPVLLKTEKGVYDPHSLIQPKIQKNISCYCYMLGKVKYKTVFANKSIIYYNDLPVLNREGSYYLFGGWGT